MKEAQSYVDAFLAGTGWKPTQSFLVAGALRYGEYDYFKEQVIEHLVLKGRKAKEPKEDYEFTDWAALSRSSTPSFAHRDSVEEIHRRVWSARLTRSGG